MDQPAPLPSRLHKEEWDFSKVPESELEACLRYELAREIEDYETFFEGPNQVVLSNDPGVEIEYLYAELINRDKQTFPYIPVPRDYPETCWQDFPAPFRRKIVFILHEATTGVLTISHPKIFSAKYAQPPEVASYLDEKTIRIQIDWSRTDGSLAEDFKTWLKVNRPEGVKIIPKVGRLSFRDDLNALAAMRLRNRYSTEEAVTITKQAFGKPLYTYRPAWTAACTRAASSFEYYYPGAGRPKSSHRKSDRRAGGGETTEK